MFLAQSSRCLVVERRPLGSRFLVICKWQGRSLVKYFRQAATAADEVLEMFGLSDEDLAELFSKKKGGEKNESVQKDV